MQSAPFIKSARKSASESGQKFLRAKFYRSTGLFVFFEVIFFFCFSRRYRSSTRYTIIICNIFAGLNRKFSRKGRQLNHSEWAFTPPPSTRVAIDIALPRCTGLGALRHLITRYVRPTRTHTRAVYRMVMLAGHLEGQRETGGKWVNSVRFCGEKPARSAPPVSIFFFFSFPVQHLDLAVVGMREINGDSRDSNPKFSPAQNRGRLAVFFFFLRASTEREYPLPIYRYERANRCVRVSNRDKSTRR